MNDLVKKLEAMINNEPWAHSNNLEKTEENDRLRDFLWARQGNPFNYTALPGDLFESSVGPDERKAEVETAMQSIITEALGGYGAGYGSATVTYDKGGMIRVYSHETTYNKTRNHLRRKSQLDEITRELFKTGTWESQDGNRTITINTKGISDYFAEDPAQKGSGFNRAMFDIMTIGDIKGSRMPQHVLANIMQEAGITATVDSANATIENCHDRTANITFTLSNADYDRVKDHLGKDAAKKPAARPLDPERFKKHPVGEPGEHEHSVIIRL